MSMRVWYASYGSNLSRHRFDRYLRGGTPNGGRHRYPGCSDRTAPAADRPVTLPYRLRFGGASRTWGGGMAFVDTLTAGRTLGRAYLISAEQFGEVHAQENGGHAGPADIAALPPGEPVRTAGGNYPMILRCDDGGHVPVLTFTAETVPRAAAPAHAYLRAIARGLAEAHRMTVAAIVRYLRSAPSVRAAYDAAVLAAIVRAGVTASMVPPPRHSSPS